MQARSRFEEDVYPNNHTSVWGSWWVDGDWGYACCHQTVKNSYCTGEAGRQVAENAQATEQRNLEAKAAAPPTSTAAPKVRLRFRHQHVRAIRTGIEKFCLHTDPQVLKRLLACLAEGSSLSSSSKYMQSKTC